MRIRLGDRDIGENVPVLVVAAIGEDLDGGLDRAGASIEAVVVAGRGV